MIAVNYHDDLNEVQADAALYGLLTAPARTAPFDRLEWWQALASDCGISPVLASARRAGDMAVLPLARTDGGMVALANWYSFFTRPVVSKGANGLALLTALARNLRGQTGRITLAPMPDEGGEASLVAQAFKAAGWLVTMEECDTNHIIHLGGQSYAQYLAARPGQLRTTLKRKAKKVAITLHDRFTDQGWADYEAIYAKSWKPEEGSPAFLKRFAQEEGRAGRLRLAVAHAEIEGVNQPVAAQLWTVEGGTAYIHKLAYIEPAKPLSPGTSLSAALFERVIDGDGVARVDFGTGDDPYKRDWMESQRPRYRIVIHRSTAPAQWPAIAKAAVAFVDDHRNRPHRLDGGQHALQVGFGGADPFGAEIFQRHPRQTGFFQERLDDEGFARAHGANGQQSHRGQGGVAFF